MAWFLLFSVASLLDPTTTFTTQRVLLALQIGFTFMDVVQGTHCCERQHAAAVQRKSI
jgi:hypothetical protein